jgi:hypothetical protein
LDQPSEHFEACDRYVCSEQWSSLHAQRLYTLALLLLQYALPLAVLLFTYSRIAAEVWGTQPPGEAHNVRDMRMAKNKRKVCSMFVACTIQTNATQQRKHSFIPFILIVPLRSIFAGALSNFRSAHFSAQFCIHRQTGADKPPDF